MVNVIIVLFLLNIGEGEPQDTMTGSITAEELIGKGEPELFGEGYSLREAAHTAFQDMCKAASEAGITIEAVSSYRSYKHQNRIWERKYKKYTADGLKPLQAIKKIVEYSTIPGTSRHHWGTDIDIIMKVDRQPKNVLSAIHFHDEGPYVKLKEWLDQHSETFGFYKVYSNQKDRKGFKYEPWHFSYKPLSCEYLKDYKKLDITTMLQKENLLGSDHFTDEFIESYISGNILDINPELLP